MAAEEKKGDDLVGSSTSTIQRQRFYVELKPGETTIVSWKKLLREAREKDKKWPHAATAATVVGLSTSGTHSSYSALEASQSALDGNSEVGQSNDSFGRSETLEHKNRATTSGNQQLKKPGVEMTKIKGEKNDGSSTKHARLANTSLKASAKTAALLDEPFSDSRTSTMVNESPLEGQGFTLDTPVVTYSKKSASSSCKSKFTSPVNAVPDASAFPLKTKHNVQQKTKKISFEKSRMKVGVGGGSSDDMHQNCVGRSVQRQVNPTTQKLLDNKKIGVFSKGQHNDKSAGSRELVDAISPGHNSSSKDSKDVSTAVNDAAPVRPFSKVLERAIEELEETVAKSKSFNVEALNGHVSWLTIERELPLEVKLKLGKVARAVQSGQKTVSEELVSRVVSILGKLVHGKSLKRILSKVVVLKLSVRNEKAEKFKEMKNEIFAMMYNRQMGAAYRSQAKEEEIFAETYKLDCSLEDKLCDLYDLCTQGLAGDKDVLVQKLFFELAELWPKGFMDHHKLRDAISRARSRRLLTDKNQVQNVVQNDNLPSSRVDDSVNRNAY